MSVETLWTDKVVAVTSIATAVILLAAGLIAWWQASEEANVWGQPNVLQIRSQVSKLGDRVPASSSR